MRGSIQKKGKAYYVVIWMRDPETGKQKHKWIKAGSTKKAAEAKYVELAPEANERTYKELKKATFEEFSKIWLKSYVERRTKPSTTRSYRDAINKQFVPRFGKRRLTEIDIDVIQRYLSERETEVKPKTVINEIVPLKLMFKHAVRWGYLKSSPAEYVDRPRVEKEEMEILNPDEIRLLLEKAKPEYGTLFLMAVLTGLRRGEIIGLQWGDIDWVHNQIHVRRSYCGTSKQLQSPKTMNARRKVDMTPTLVHELKKHKLSCPKGELDLVFPNSDGGILDPDNMIKRGFLPALSEAKLRTVRFHDLRHTNVSLRIEQGQNLVYISKQIGHASVSTTLNVYSHLLKEAHPEQAERLDAILGFAEQPGSPSKFVRRSLEDRPEGKRPKKSVRRSLEDYPKIDKKGAADKLQPLEFIGSGGRI